MPRNGSGTYQLPAGNPVVTGTPISSSVQNTTMSDVASALTTSIATDGQTPMAANLPMASNKLTGLSAGAMAGDSLRFEQLFSQGTETTIASATTMDIGGQNTAFLNVTGTTTITSFGSNFNGPRYLRFSGAVLLTNSTSLVLPGATNITTAAGDVFIAYPLAAAAGWQVQQLISATNLITQRWTTFTTAGTAPAFTLTPSVPLLAYVAGQRFNVTFNAAGTTGSNTLNISGVGAGNLKQYDSTGAKQSGIIPSGFVSDIEYDGTDFVILNPLPNGQINSKIQPVSATVATNALTLTLNPTSLDFRSATLGSGTVNTRTNAAAISTVISSGSTGGTLNTIQNKIIVLAIDNAGTMELAWVNSTSGKNLDETTLISTTAEGGSGAADSATTIYSTTARTNVPFRVVGYVESTQATAGTWVTAPSKIQGIGGNLIIGPSNAENSSRAFAYVTTPGGIPTLQEGFNISSTITNNGTGDATFSFVNARPDANYSVLITAEEETAGASPRIGYVRGGSKTASSFRVQIVNLAGGFVNCPYSISVFGTP